MPKGTALGVDREYQVTCRDVLGHRHPKMVPWLGDGIDVPFALPDTTWTFDVALQTSDGEPVVAECRRTMTPVKQRDVAAFALAVESLRHTLGKSVSAFFFTKTAHQLGAVRVGQFYGIEIALLGEDACPPSFNMTFLSYDAYRDRKLRHLVKHVDTGHIEISGHAPTVVQSNLTGTEEE